ncbi:MAG: hypothetical protein ACLGXA_03665, partial [Acidobacteriota bacterium]
MNHERRSILIAELLAVIFMGAVAGAAHWSGVNLLLFPELAALSHDVLTRPRGQWASQPFRLVLTPTLAAVAGLLITRHARYGAISILLIVLAALAIIRLLRSAIGPALSAAVLPMALGERRWSYPLAIAAGLSGLILLLWLWKRFGPAIHVAPRQTNEDAIDDALESESRGRPWLPSLLIFVLILAAAGEVTGLRFLLFPPLVVMAYEILGHPELRDWMQRPALFPVVCFLTALVGLLACRYLGGTVTGVVVAVAVSIVLLRIFRMHMPPALAIGLLPFVMTAPTFWYPLSVGIGTTALSVWQPLP